MEDIEQSCIREQAGFIVLKGDVLQDPQSDFKQETPNAGIWAQTDLTPRNNRFVPAISVATGTQRMVITDP